jgi:hypothetical protein
MIGSVGAFPSRDVEMAAVVAHRLVDLLGTEVIPLSDVLARLARRRELRDRRSPDIPARSFEAPTFVSTQCWVLLFWNGRVTTLKSRCWIS